MRCDDYMLQRSMPYGRDTVACPNSSTQPTWRFVVPRYALPLAAILSLLPPLGHAEVSSGTAAATQLSAQAIYPRAVERNAVNAVIWAMPVVNYDLMYQAALANKMKPNQFIYWSRLPDWKNQTLTPNPGAIYLMTFLNTKDGPVVLEVPPASDEGSITGNLDDAWQIALEDIGTAGADKGSGGKYLILPPGYKDKAPEGYIVLQSSTLQNFALLRSILKDGSPAGIAKAVAYGKRAKVYPLSQAANPPETAYLDVADVVFDSTIPYDLRFFQSLDRIVQSEPWMERDRAMIDPLKSLGIEKGKPFNPDAKTKQLLGKAAGEAKAWIDRLYEQMFTAPFYPGTHWAFPASPAAIEGQSDGYAKRDEYPIYARGTTYSMGFIGIKHLGSGQYYLVSLKDKQGKPLDGKRTYKLTFPPDVPVTQYWSATAYDRDTHAFIRNVPNAGRSSQEPALKKNADGSVDLYFGPKPLAGKEANWVPTSPKASFEVMLRFYGPEKAFMDKSWKLGDIEVVK